MTTARARPGWMGVRALVLAAVGVVCAAAALLLVALLHTTPAPPSGALPAGHPEVTSRAPVAMPVRDASVAVAAPASVASHPAGGSEDAAKAALEPYIAKARTRVDASPGDGEAWLLLARSYVSAAQAEPALDAYAHAVKLAPRNADLLIEYANATAMAHDRRFAGEPERLIAAALAIAPDNRNALALAGAADLQAGRRDAAVTHWSRLLATLPADAPGRARLVALIAHARGETPPASAATIRGTVSLASSLAAKLGPNDTLFVFARAVDGPAMPLAVLRTRPSAWPASFTLDDSQRMAPGLVLSRYPRVDIVARISHSGNATVQPGDLEGRIANVALGSDGVHVVIDRIAER